MSNERAEDYSSKDTSLPASDSQNICPTFDDTDTDAKIISESVDDVGITNSVITCTFSEIAETMNNDMDANYSSNETIYLPAPDSEYIYATSDEMDVDAKICSGNGDDFGITNSMYYEDYTASLPYESNGCAPDYSWNAGGLKCLDIRVREVTDILTATGNASHFDDFSESFKSDDSAPDYSWDIYVVNILGDNIREVDPGSEGSESTQRFYIRIRNLPNIACQDEVKTLLNEFDGPKGRMSINGSDALVAFTDSHTALDAYNRIQDLLYGTAMRASLVKTAEKVKEATCQKVKRNLIFDFDASLKETSDKSDQENETESDNLISDEETPKVSAPVCGRKRIRPTPIPWGYRRYPFSCKNFRPEEIALPKRAFEHGLPRSGMNMEQPRCRKIRPNPEIRKESFEDLESSVEYPEAKRKKLEPSSSGGDDKA